LSTLKIHIYTTYVSFFLNTVYEQEHQIPNITSMTQNQQQWSGRSTSHWIKTNK